MTFSDHLCGFTKVSIAPYTMATAFWDEALWRESDTSSVTGGVEQPGLLLCAVGGLLGATVFLADTFPTVAS